MKLNNDFKIRDCMNNTLEANLFWIGAELGLIICLLIILIIMVGSL